jgi:hypothetical protein
VTTVLGQYIMKQKNNTTNTRQFIKQITNENLFKLSHGLSWQKERL